MSLKEKLKILRQERMVVLKIKEDERFVSCEWEKDKEVCIELATWFIEASFYCDKHVEKVVDIILNL